MRYKLIEENAFCIPASTYVVGLKPILVVADAAMKSSECITELVNHKQTFIVGDRPGSLSPEVIEQVNKKLYS